MSGCYIVKKEAQCGRFGQHSGTCVDAFLFAGCVSPSPEVHELSKFNASGIVAGR